MSGRRILYVASNMRHINNFHSDYIKALRDGGDTVDVLAAGEGADVSVPFEKKIFSRGNTKCRKMIREAVERGNYDAILLNTSLAAFHTRLALKGRGRPRVVNLVHGYLFSEDTGLLKSTLLKLAERTVAKRTDAIITMNAWDLEYARAKKLTRGRVYASHGMGARISEPITDPARLRSEFLGDGRVVFCFVGELSARKNQELLIRSHARILKEIPNALLWLVGDGGEQGRLSALAKELGISESVLFVGQRTDAKDFMRACDVYVSASSIEGLPFNILEALALGKTVVASRIKGHVDLIEDGVSGYLFALRDPDAYVKSAVFAARGGRIDPEAARSAARPYEYDRAFPEMLEIMKEALNG